MTIDQCLNSPTQRIAVDICDEVQRRAEAAGLSCMERWSMRVTVRMDMTGDEIARAIDDAIAAVKRRRTTSGGNPS